MAQIKMIVWPHDPSTRVAVGPFEDLDGCQAVRVFSRYARANGHDPYRFHDAEFAVVWTDAAGGRWVRQANSDLTFRPDTNLPDVASTRTPGDDTIQEAWRYALSDGC